DGLDGDGQQGGKALDDDDEGLAVRLAGGQVAQHRARLPRGVFPLPLLVTARGGRWGPAARRPRASPEQWWSSSTPTAGTLAAGTLTAGTGTAGPSWPSPGRAGPASATGRHRCW